MPLGHSVIVSLFSSGSLNDLWKHSRNVPEQLHSTMEWTTFPIWPGNASEFLRAGGAGQHYFFPHLYSDMNWLALYLNLKIYKLHFTMYMTWFPL